MNEEPPPPFDTIGDEPVEARIVAWVLGEASAFEAAELERLCEERPELLVFRRRMRALHGLLTEAEAAEPDESWKLPAEKRKLLDEIFGGEKIPQLELQNEERIRHSGRRALLAIAACLVLTVVVAGLLGPMRLMGPVETTKLEVKPDSAALKAKAEQTLQGLNRAVRDQEDKVEERRKVLADVVRSKGVIYKGKDSFYGQSGVDEDQGARSALQTYNQLQEDKMQLESQVNSLLKYDSDQLMVYAAGLDLPDNVIKNVHPLYLESKRHLEDLRIKGLGDDHPTVKASKNQIQTMKHQLDEGVVSLRAQLQGKLEMAKDSLKKVEGMKDGNRDEAIKRGLDAQDYADAKREFESDQQLLQQLKLKQIELAAASGATDDALAENSGAKSRRWNSTPSQPAGPAAAPVGRSSSSGGESLAIRSDRKAGKSEIALQPAKQLAQQPASAAAADSFSSTDSVLPAQTTAPAAELAMDLSGKDVGFFARGGITDNEEIASQSRAGVNLGERFATDGDVAGASGGAIPADSFQLGMNGVIGGLRSGDQAINRNNVDAILNNPNRSETEGSAKAKESKSEFSTKLPALAAKESDLPDDAFGEPAAAGDMLDVLAEHSHELPEAQKKFADSATDGKDFRSSLVTGREMSADDANQASPAESAEHGDKVDQLRRYLYAAEGNYNLGKYDDAKKAYQDALKVDPYNPAARRGLEQVEVAKSDYYRASNDHTRAELLSQIDDAWELAVPANAPALKNKETKAADLAELQQRLATLRKQLEDPVANSKKQALFKEWQELQKELAEIADEETPAKPDEAQAKLTDLMEEIPAAENPYSTFSLNISDASFQLAKAALAKGERPDPASIKPEQFYNAVDYGDPAPASNEPVAATIEQAAHPVIPGRNLVRVALRTGSVGRSAVQPLRLTLLVDQSGSMVREDRRASMEHALSQLGVLLTKADQVTVIGFSRTPHLLAEGMTGDQAAKLGELVNQTASEGGTNLEEALKLAGKLAARHQLAGAQNRIVLFTDGAANLGDANPERLAEQVKALRQKGIAFDIAGIGADDLNDRLLSELARNGNGRYYVVGSDNNDSFARQLAGAFRPAAENVKVQVNFNPQRVGKYKLIGFEKDRLKTEDFRNDSVDAAELAAEEAGVAIYQVEPLADGTGELGEVSVRFRDAASKEMVERSWTISHDSQATAFDRATPSMQLAGLSLLAAEKLRGGPLADAIDFKQLTGPSAFVKQFYGSSPRVSEMLQVIEKLK